MGRLDDDHLLLGPGLAAARWCATATRLDYHGLRADDLLRRRLQVAAGLSPLAKALDRGEYVGLLGRERVAELL